MTNGVVPRNGSAVSTACASPSGAYCSMYVICDAELRAVARGLADLAAGLRRDDDPDLADARGRHRLDPVEQDRLVRDGDELLRRRVGDRPQARAFAAREDQALELLHGSGRLA